MAAVLLGSWECTPPVRVCVGRVVVEEPHNHAPAQQEGDLSAYLARKKLK